MQLLFQKATSAGRTKDRCRKKKKKQTSRRKVKAEKLTGIGSGKRNRIPPADKPFRVRKQPGKRIPKGSIRCMGLLSGTTEERMFQRKPQIQRAEHSKNSPHSSANPDRSAKGKEISDRKPRVQPDKTKRKRLKSVKSGSRSELSGINVPRR